MTLEKLHDDAETKRAQKDIESALNITETKEEDEDSNRIVVYDRSRSTASSTKPLASKPKKTKPCESKTCKLPIKRKATTASRCTQQKQRKITDLLSPDPAAVFKNKFSRIVLKDYNKK